ncbi:hypothetical protein [Tepidibacillus marianensis]|uniref:hypothetical protein n=1 Tax=Tepidibacillus marianensis TaxID=3131995 RepID=UPI0030CCABE6
MEKTIHPEFVFIQSNILFIFDPSFNHLIKNFFPKDSKMFSISLPSLWELRKENEEDTLLLHLDWPEPIGLITLAFLSEHTGLLNGNQNFHSLGILNQLNIETGEAEQVLFITGIEEGLSMVIHQDYSSSNQL